MPSPGVSALEDKQELQPPEYFRSRQLGNIFVLHLVQICSQLYGKNLILIKKYGSLDSKAHMQCKTRFPQQTVK